MSITVTASSASVDGARTLSTGISPERAFVTGGRLNKSSSTERVAAAPVDSGFQACSLHELFLHLTPEQVNA